jgi:hypothetical protein
MRVRVPPVPAGDSFQWLKQPDGDIPIDAKWYIDGSMFDGTVPLIGRTGFGVVVTSMEGDLLAYGMGIPPDWIRDASGAEAWALAVILRWCPSMPDTTTDCMNVVTTLHAGKAAATDAASPLARIWAEVLKAFDDSDCDQQGLASIRWMPAHGSQHSIGAATKSDDCTVTSLDWRANRLADQLAKKAAHETRVSCRVRCLARTAAATVSYALAKLGFVTHAANHFSVETVAADGTVTRCCKRDSTACRPGRNGSTSVRGRRCVTESTCNGVPDTVVAPRLSLHAIALPQSRGPLAEAARQYRKRKAVDLECQAEMAFQVYWRRRMNERSVQTPQPGDSGARLAAVRARVAAREADASSRQV